MLESALDNLKKYALGKKLGLAVSGGVDSMCLMHLVLNCGLFQKKDVVIVNFEHGIRGVESVKDTAFVQSYCAMQGVECLCFSENVPEKARQQNLSEETRARIFRRQTYMTLLEQSKFDLLATAHHAQDNAETLLMHILRGCGLNGLKGMEVIAGGLFKPLLSCGKEEISGYAENYKIPFVTDSTNADDKYSRNFLRLKVMPLLNERYDCEKALNALSRRAAADEKFIESQLDGRLLQRGQDYCKIGLKAFENEALSARYVLKALAMLDVNSDYESKTLDSVSRLVDLKNGSFADIGNGLKAVREYDGLTLFFPKEKCGLSAAYREGELRLNDAVISVVQCRTQFLKGKFIVDADKIPLGSEFRFRREGDRFKPFKSGEKKLKEYFIDLKVPVRERDSIPLLCCGHEVLAVLGMQISDKIKLDASTQRAVELCCQRKQ